MCITINVYIQIIMQPLKYSGSYINLKKYGIAIDCSEPVFNCGNFLN